MTIKYLNVLLLIIMTTQLYAQPVDITNSLYETYDSYKEPTLNKSGQVARALGTFDFCATVPSSGPVQTSGHRWP